MTLFERVHMPSFAGATEWLDSEPLGPAEQPARRDRETNMNTEAQSQSEDRDRETTTGRSPLALFVVVELLCTGALVASILLWM
jgi:hypothetical protein